MPNGIDIVMADHRLVEGLFAAFAETPSATIVGQVIDMLEAHDDAEQAALYPLIGAVLGDADAVARAERAHSSVKRQIEKVAGLEGPPLVDAFAELQALVAEHVRDEEERLLPALAERATAQQLEGLGARLLQAKQRVG